MELSGSRKRKRVSKAVIKRLPNYYAVLTRFRQAGREWISSECLASELGLTAPTVRQDLSNFGRFGTSSYGYAVEELIKALGSILAIDRGMDLVVVGAGNIGRAMVGYRNFLDLGLNPVAIFDHNPRKIGTEVDHLTIRSTDDIEGFMACEGADIGVVAVPKEAAQRIADRLVECGIRALFNFAPVMLKVPDEIAVSNVHLCTELLALAFRARELNGDS